MKIVSLLYDMGKRPDIHILMSKKLELGPAHSFAYGPGCTVAWCKRRTAVINQAAHKLKSIVLLLLLEKNHSSLIEAEKPELPSSTHHT